MVLIHFSKQGGGSNFVTLTNLFSIKQIIIVGHCFDLLFKLRAIYKRDVQSILARSNPVPFFLTKLIQYPMHLPSNKKLSHASGFRLIIIPRVSFPGENA